MSVTCAARPRVTGNAAAPALSSAPASATGAPAPRENAAAHSDGQIGAGAIALPVARRTQLAAVGRQGPARWHRSAKKIVWEWKLRQHRGVHCWETDRLLKTRDLWGGGERRERSNAAAPSRRGPTGPRAAAPPCSGCGGCARGAWRCPGACAAWSRCRRRAGTAGATGG